MHIVSFLSQKGGSGKTTLALHLAVAAEQKGLKSAIIDIDPQRSAAAWHEGRKADSPLLAECTAAELPDILNECRAAGIGLAVIDTAPHSNPEALKSAKASDFVLIPCRPTILDLRAVGPSMDITAQAGVQSAIVLTSCPPPHGVGEPAIVQEARQTLKSDYHTIVWPGRITQRAAYHYALIDSQAVTEFEPKGKSAQEIRELWKWVSGRLS